MIKDHEGREYSTVQLMCDRWGVKSNSYYMRLRKGWTLEECLIGRRLVCDHLGNKFLTAYSMCQHWGVSIKTYCLKKKKGAPLEDILTKKQKPKKIVRDHLGKEYTSITKMCEAYKIRGPKELHNRLKRFDGDLEKALTAPLKRIVDAVDHTGRHFVNLIEMCKHWGVSRSTYLDHRKKGMSLEDCLKHKQREKKEPKADLRFICHDHLGVQYMNPTSMCAAYGMTLRAFRDRQRAGLSLEDALITPKTVKAQFVQSGENRYFFFNKEKFLTPLDAAKKHGLTNSSFFGMSEEEICKFFDKSGKRALFVCFGERKEPQRTKPETATYRLLMSWGFSCEEAEEIRQRLQKNFAAEVKKLTHYRANHEGINVLFERAHICPRTIGWYANNRYNTGLFTLKECALSPRAFKKLLLERFHD